VSQLVNCRATIDAVRPAPLLGGQLRFVSIRALAQHCRLKMCEQRVLPPAELNDKREHALELVQQVTGSLG